MFQACHQCKKPFMDDGYKKDDVGHGLYWINPKLCKFTEVRLDFCGPICSNEWFADQLAAHEAIRQETDSGTDPV